MDYRQNYVTDNTVTAPGGHLLWTGPGALTPQAYIDGRRLSARRLIALLAGVRTTRKNPLFRATCGEPRCVALKHMKF